MLLENTYVCFQNTDKRRIISDKALSLFQSQNTYGKFEDHLIILDSKIEAIYDKNTKKLLFRSYNQTNKFLDLSQYYREATNEEIKELLKNSKIQCENQGSFIECADTQIRKKIALISENRILDNLDINAVKEKSNEYNINLQVQNGKIVIPNDKKEIKSILKFLNQEYFTSDLNGTKYQTNSKRPIY